ncbi:MAG TPA: hypothetical protein VHT96_15470 [Clostridia bacterium]|nr:hypothetical protein [Clostridia bacterium]
MSEFSKRTMIPVTIRSRDKEGIIPEEMAQGLSSSMLILSVDTKYLSYNKLYAENENRQHAIVLNGIDFSEKCVHIMDLYVLDYMGNVSTYSGTISFDEMMAATYRYSYFCFDNKKDLSMSEILQYAYVDFMEFMKGSENSEGAFGALALENFLKDILKLEELDDRDLASTSKNINYNIKIRSFNYINKYLACFIEENSDLTNRYNQELLERIRWHMAEWEKVGLAVIKIGISKRRGSLVNIFEKSSQLFDSQLKVYEQFSCVLEEAVSNCS